MSRPSRTSFSAWFWTDIPMVSKAPERAHRGGIKAQNRSNRRHARHARHNRHAPQHRTQSDTKRITSTAPEHDRNSDSPGRERLRSRGLG